MCSGNSKTDVFGGIFLGKVDVLLGRGKGNMGMPGNMGMHCAKLTETRQRYILEETGTQSKLKRQPP